VTVDTADANALYSLSQEAPIHALLPSNQVLVSIPRTQPLSFSPRILYQQDTDNKETNLIVVECQINDCREWFKLVSRTFGQFAIYSAPTFWIIRDVTPAQALETLPSYTRVVSVPSDPIVFHGSSASHHKKKRQNNEFIEDWIAQVSQSEMRTFLDGLTNGFHTRLSTSDDSKVAADWLVEQFADIGYDADLWSYPVPINYPPNVIADLPGRVNPGRIVVIGGHFDCRASNINSVTQRAPGANDDGSGTAAVLEIARILRNASFENTIRFAAWSGEEQGLY